MFLYPLVLDCSAIFGQPLRLSRVYLGGRDKAEKNVVGVDVTNYIVPALFFWHLQTEASSRDAFISPRVDKMKVCAAF